ncbi:FAD binding domain-containing protein [Syncephalis plumigaleata]|nr:FAD binding domain-containing protein [Syncephalis plumigaleata]
MLHRQNYVRHIPLCSLSFELLPTTDMEFNDSNSTTTQLPLPVIVIGAGPSGLTAALCLAEQRVPVVIYDSAPQPSTQWRAPGVAPHSLEVFARLGVAETLLEDGVCMGPPGIYIGTQRVFGNKARTARTEYPFYFSAPQSSTEGVLRDRLAALGVDVKWGWSFSSYSTTNDSVSIELQSTTNAEETIQVQGSYVIGCDGLRSAVRNAIGEAFDKRDRSVKMLGMDFYMKEKWDTMRVYWHTSGSILVIPLGKDRYRSFIRINEPIEETSEVFVDVMRKRIMPTTIPDPDIVGVASFTVFDQVANKFRSSDGRVFLCGDAAHVQNPSAAQGMNSAIGDAENLGWKLGLVARGMAAPEKLLTTYEDERRPFVLSTVQRRSFINSITDKLPVVLQHMAFRIVGKLLDSLPEKVRRATFEKASQLSNKYDGTGAATLKDIERWTIPTWNPFARKVDLCSPGSRAINSTLISLDRSKLVNDSINDSTDNTINDVSSFGVKTQVHGYIREHFGRFIAMAFVNEQCLNQEVLNSLQTLMATLHAHQSVAPLAIILYNTSNAITTLLAAQKIYDAFKVNNDITVLADQTQDVQYDRLTMCQQYNCHVLGAPTVYLIRPDAHVACRSLLVTAPNHISQYLTAFVTLSSLD